MCLSRSDYFGATFPPSRPLWSSEFLGRLPVLLNKRTCVDVKTRAIDNEINAVMPVYRDVQLAGARVLGLRPGVSPARKL
jgi:hypothetical protein